MQKAHLWKRSYRLSFEPELIGLSEKHIYGRNRMWNLYSEILFFTVVNFFSASTLLEEG